MLHWFGQIEETKSPLCGTLSGIDRILPLYLKCVSIERQRVMVLAATLETHLVVSRKKIRKHRRNFNNEKIFPSPNTTTTRLISSVIITIMGLRNIRSLIIWWKCLWDMDRTLKEGSMDYTLSPICMRLVLRTRFLMERDQVNQDLQQGENPSGHSNIIVDCESNNMFGDLNPAPYIIF